MPNHVPLLHRINNKDPIPKENFDYGVNYMGSEYSNKYKTPKPNEYDKNHVSVGPQEFSGFVTNKESDPLTFLPGYLAVLTIKLKFFFINIDY